MRSRCTYDPHDQLGGAAIVQFVQVLGSNGEVKLVFAFLSVPFALVVLRMFVLDWMWRSHRAKQEQQPSEQDTAELRRLRDLPDWV
jgi:hypothetical protein